MQKNMRVATSSQTSRAAFLPGTLSIQAEAGLQNRKCMCNQPYHKHAHATTQHRIAPHAVGGRHNRRHNRIIGHSPATNTPALPRIAFKLRMAGGSRAVGSGPAPSSAGERCAAAACCAASGVSSGRRCRHCPRSPPDTSHFNTCLQHTCGIMQVGVSVRVGMLKVQRWADAAGIAQAST
jgi:hypothetical protein